MEHENDAEVMLADMEFDPEDHESERQLKLQVGGCQDITLSQAQWVGLGWARLRQG